MNALPDPLPVGAIHHLPTIDYANLDPNKYYLMRKQRLEPDAPLQYSEYIVYLDEQVPQGPYLPPWKNDHRVIVKLLYSRTYKRVFDAAIVEGAGVQLHPDAAEHNGEVMDGLEYNNIVPYSIRRYRGWIRLPYAIQHNENNMNMEGDIGHFVYNHWVEFEDVISIPADQVKENPGPDELAYTFYALPQAGGLRRKHRRTAHRRPSKRVRRRSTRRSRR